MAKFLLRHFFLRRGIFYIMIYCTCNLTKETNQMDNYRQISFEDVIRNNAIEARFENSGNGKAIARAIYQQE